MSEILLSLSPEQNYCFRVVFFFGRCEFACIKTNTVSLREIFVLVARRVRRIEARGVTEATLIIRSAQAHTPTEQREYGGAERRRLLAPPLRRQPAAESNRFLFSATAKAPSQAARAIRAKVFKIQVQLEHATTRK